MNQYIVIGFFTSSPLYVRSKKLLKVYNLSMHAETMEYILHEGFVEQRLGNVVHRGMMLKSLLIAIDKCQLRQIDKYGNPLQV